MPDEKPKRILIVESEKAYSKALVLKLQKAGYEAESAQNGEEALMAIWKGNFDLLLCDLIIPKMDGFEVLAQIKKEKPDLPVIVLSNLSQMDDEKKARELGAIDFLIKSNVTIIEVITKVEQILNMPI
jgi:DNA-binding response OmpR family regulator